MIVSSDRSVLVSQWTPSSQCRLVSTVLCDLPMYGTLIESQCLVVVLYSSMSVGSRLSQRTIRSDCLHSKEQFPFCCSHWNSFLASAAPSVQQASVVIFMVRPTKSDLWMRDRRMNTNQDSPLLRCLCRTVLFGPRITIALTAPVWMVRFNAVKKYVPTSNVDL